MFVEFGGDYLPARADLACEQHGLAARRRTEVKYTLAGIGRQKPRHGLRSLILERDPTFAHRFTHRRVSPFEYARISEQPPRPNPAAGSLQRLHRIPAMLRVKQIPRKG